MLYNENKKQNSTFDNLSKVLKRQSISVNVKVGRKMRMNLRKEKKGNQFYQWVNYHLSVITYKYNSSNDLFDRHNMTCCDLMHTTINLS